MEGSSYRNFFLPGEGTIWNEMTAAYVNEGRTKEVPSLFILMESDGFEADAITYNTILAGPARNGQRTDAYRLLSMMLLSRFES